MTIYELNGLRWANAEVAKQALGLADAYGVTLGSLVGGKIKNRRVMEPRRALREWVRKYIRCTIAKTGRSKRNQIVTFVPLESPGSVKLSTPVAAALLGQSHGVYFTRKRKVKCPTYEQAAVT